MKKLLISLLAAFTLTACASASDPEIVESADTAIVEEVETNDVPLNILAPMGAPALSMLKAALNPMENVEFVNGADLLKAAFIAPDSEYDVIVAPSNLGANLAATGNTEYRMAGIVTWGNLYLIGNDEDVLSNPNAELALFGEGSVVELVYNDVLKEEVKANTTMYGSVQDVQAALLSGDADAGLIAEPAASATIDQANQAGIELTFVADLQELWKTKYDQEGYPQAAIFIKPSTIENNEEKITEFLTQVESSLNSYQDADSTILASDLDKVGVENLGVPSADLISKVWPKMNLRYISANDSVEELNSFMSLFGIEDSNTYTIQ